MPCSAAMRRIHLSLLMLMCLFARCARGNGEWGMGNGGWGMECGSGLFTIPHSLFPIPGPHVLLMEIIGKPMISFSALSGRRAAEGRGGRGELAPTYEARPEERRGRSESSW